MKKCSLGKKRQRKHYLHDNTNSTGKIGIVFNNFDFCMESTFEKCILIIVNFIEIK